MDRGIWELTYIWYNENKIEWERRICILCMNDNEGYGYGINESENGIWEIIILL